MSSSLQKQERLYIGKAKSLYATNDPTLLIAEFRDDTSAFDGQKIEQLSEKGRVNCLISQHIMGVLQEAGIATHFVSTYSATESVVRHLKMVPLESVVRNIAAGSLCRRLGVASGQTLSPPMYEIFLKNDELHDPMVNNDHATQFGWATETQLHQMRELSFAVHAKLTELFDAAGLMLVDAKYEFGVDHEGVMRLGDEVSPDSCRVWDKETGKPLDKDRFRQDLGEVVESYQIIAHRLGIELNAVN